MKKTILKVLCLTMILSLTTGCGEKSIKKLMREKYDILSAKEIDREAIDKDNEDERCAGTNYYISATVKNGLSKEIKFHVHQSYVWAGEWCMTHYENDFEDVMLNQYFDTFKKRKNLSKEYKVEYLVDDQYPLNKFKVLGTFNNRAELESLLDEFLLFGKHTLKQKYNEFNIPFTFVKNTKYFNYEISKNYYYVEHKKRKNQNFEYSLKKDKIGDYLHQILINYDTEAMKDFSQKEIREKLDNYSDEYVGIKNGDTCNFYDKYISNYRSDISMGTLYYILKDRGYNVDGNQYNYTITINSHTLSCDILSEEICKIDDEIIREMDYFDEDVYSNDKTISTSKLNDLLDLNICTE